MTAQLDGGGFAGAANPERGPASLVQEGLWVLQSKASSDHAYHEVICLTLNGKLDLLRLEEALTQVVSRHAALRTRFFAGPCGLEQQVLPGSRVHLPLRDLAETALAGWIESIYRPAFDLNKGPLFRAALARLADDHYVLTLAAHHLVVDGWSLGVFQRDLGAFYAAGADARALLPPLDTSMVEYALAERRRVAGPAGASARAFWLAYLKGSNVGSRGPGGDVTSFAVTVSRERTQAIRAVARGLRTSPFAVIFASFARAMHTVTGRCDLMLATDFSGRTEPAYEGLIGMFANQTPIRCRAMETVSGADAVRDAQRLVIEVLAHAHLPFPQIAALGPSREGSLFEAKFVLHNMPRQPLQLEGLYVQELEIAPEVAKFPVLVELWDKVGTLEGRVTVDPVRSTVNAAELASRFDSVLAQISSNPDALLPTLRQQAVFKPGRRRVDFAPTVRIIESPWPSVPVRVECASEDLDFVAWIEQEKDNLLARLWTAGALLLRGFDVGGAESFARISQALGGELMPYVQRSSPRTKVGRGVYTSTEYPRDVPIDFHNENAYASTWPATLFFWCEVAPAAGGRTPLADCRAVLTNLPARVRVPLTNEGVIYRRRFREGLGLDFREVFQVGDIHSLRVLYEPQGYRFSTGPQGELVADYAAPATVTHPATGAQSWFNHVGLFHAEGLPEQVRTVVGGLEVDTLLPIEPLLGSGATIPGDWVAEIRAAYRAASMLFDWQRGDLLVIDNRLTAHAREPFMPPRRILVAMTDAQHHTLLHKEFPDHE